LTEELVIQVRTGSGPARAIAEGPSAIAAERSATPRSTFALRTLII
jgi:hypothetical protein